MAAIQDVDTAGAEYDRLFGNLVQMAADLDVPPDEADRLIGDVLLSTLVGRHMNDIDRWVAAAFTFAVSQRGGRR
ncbi:MAG TPA: hypothetical protein VGD79_12370 [Thermoanaerobaculia bacterium]|jgi:hypothetical protein